MTNVNESGQSHRSHVLALQWLAIIDVAVSGGRCTTSLMEVVLTYSPAVHEEVFRLLGQGVGQPCEEPCDLAAARSRAS